MRNILAAAAMVGALSGFAGIGHNMPPANTAQSAPKTHAVLPRRIVDENRRNQKLKQRIRKQKRRKYLSLGNRAVRKSVRYGYGYRPGKLFKGHRV